MNEINDVPAFPIAGAVASYQYPGMGLRDYFAAKAMHQFLAGSVLPTGYDATADFDVVAQRAYEVADSMLKARQS